jgi:LPS export ABC transporter protein LptC
MHTQFAVLFSLLLVWLTSCSNLETSKYRSKKNDTLATKEIAENVVIEYTDSGLLKAKVKSPLLVAVKHVREPYVEMPKGIQAEFYGNKGKVESYLLSEYGISYQNKKRVVVRRNVRVLNIKCEKLETEELTWDQEKGRIFTDKFVKITTPDQIITGEGMESDQSFSNWEILNVSGTINRKKNDTIPCDESVIPRDLRNNRH